MNHHPIAIILLCIICIFAFNTYAAENCQTNNANDLISILQSGIQKNEAFKQSGGDALLREPLETLDEDILTPCVRQAVFILKRERNDTLLNTILKLMVSYENSANETYSDAFAELWKHDPKSVKKAMKQFSASDQGILMERLHSQIGN